MIPSAWQGVVLALAVYRLCRLAGWDDLPPVVAARAWLVGAELVTVGSTNDRLGVTEKVRMETSTRYRRPVLAHFLGCAFCFGFWLSVLVYVAWRLTPDWTLVAAAPLALSAAAGLVAKRLDP